MVLQSVLQSIDVYGITIFMAGKLFKYKKMFLTSVLVLVVFKIKNLEIFTVLLLLLCVGAWNIY